MWNTLEGEEAVWQGKREKEENEEVNTGDSRLANWSCRG